MSYSIYIGEADIESDEDGVRVIVREVTDPESPSFLEDDLSTHKNARHPSYAGWEDFCDAVGLRDLFFHEDTGLMREHPGSFRLTKAHHETVVAALESRRKRYPRAVAGFGEDRDPMLARLIWLEYWIGKALRTCKVPTIANH